MNTATIIFIIANLVITSGYSFVGWKIAPNFKLKYLYTKIGGVFFFFLCGLTHGQMAYDAWRFINHMPLNWWTVGYHVAQAVAVWVFVLGIYREFIVEGRTARAVESQE